MRVHSRPQFLVLNLIADEINVDQKAANLTNNSKKKNSKKKLLQILKAGILLSSRSGQVRSAKLKRSNFPIILWAEIQVFQTMLIFQTWLQYVICNLDVVNVHSKATWMPTEVDALFYKHILFILCTATKSTAKPYLIYILKQQFEFE